MAECFCGCGREMERPASKQERRTVGLLAKLREARGSVARGERQPSSARQRGGLIFGSLNHLDLLIQVGEECRDSLVVVAHGEYFPSASQAGQFHHDWGRWSREAILVCRKRGVPVSRLGAFTGRV